MRLGGIRSIFSLACIAVAALTAVESRAAIIISEVDPNGSSASYAPTGLS